MRAATRTWPLMAVAFRFTLLAFAAADAHAYLTVGPHGTYGTIQSAVDAAITGGEIRVEQCFIAGCGRLESVNITTGNITLSGGWSSDFQSQPSGYVTTVLGDGSAAPIMQITETGGSISISRFVFDGSGYAGSSTSGLKASCHNATLGLYSNTFHGSHAQGGFGGAGLSLNATDCSTVVDGNMIDGNSMAGTSASPTFGAGAYLNVVGGSIVFAYNTVKNNTLSNSSGGGCRGGGLYGYFNASATVYGNTYTGNAQLFCTNGATADAAEILVTNGASCWLNDEVWTSNNVPNDPGVYEVFVQSLNSSNIYSWNGLITHGTWGGLFLSSDATSHIYLSNYTIADNPSVGVTAYGSGTNIWNSLLWNNSADLDLHTSAYVAGTLAGIDPLFVDETNGNYRLQWGSPAINYGINSPAAGVRSPDMDGHPRPFGGGVDAGAYEYYERIFANGFE